MRGHTSVLIIAALLAGGLALPSAEAAPACAAAPVTARGEASTFQWLARTKARANWRVKVRRLKGLGADYANWNEARSTAYECGQNGKGIACTVSAIPCHP